MISRGREKKEHAANQAAEAPFQIEAGGELQLTEEQADVMRHSQLKWVRIPEPVRKGVLPFLTVKETLRLNTAVTPGKEKEREHLERAYIGLRSRGFAVACASEHRFAWPLARVLIFRHPLR